MTIPSAAPRLDLPLVPAASGTVRLPGSKSISNRALLLAALAEGETVLLDLLQSDDTAVMLDSLTKLGNSVAQTGTTCRVEGRGGDFPQLTTDLHVGNSGLSMRTLVPALVAALNGKEGRITLSGTPRMHERPIGDLVEGLRQLGADIRYLGQEGFPPLALHGTKLTATTLRVAGATSSQFLTGLLQAAPLLARKQPLEIVVEGELISKPYVEMTLAMMARFGVTVERDGWQRFTIAPGQTLSRHSVPAGGRGCVFGFLLSGCWRHYRRAGAGGRRGARQHSGRCQICRCAGADGRDHRQG
jgi:3-phosphoshikimate 1-carboxyvinyltransferase